MQRPPELWLRPAPPRRAQVRRLSGEEKWRPYIQLRKVGGRCGRARR